MTLTDTAALVVSIMTIITTVAMGIRWLVKHYLAELRPNSGGSIKDQVNRLEEQNKTLSDKIDRMYDILLQHIAKGRD